MVLQRQCVSVAEPDEVASAKTQRSGVQVWPQLTGKEELVCALRDEPESDDLLVATRLFWGTQRERLLPLPIRPRLKKQFLLKPLSLPR